LRFANDSYLPRCQSYKASYSHSLYQQRNSSLAGIVVQCTT